MTRSEFEHIATTLRQTMLKVGLSFFGSKDDAEDATQEAMMQLWRYCEHIDARRNVQGLAVKVTKNCCVSMLRKRQREAFASDIDPLANSTPTLSSDSPQEKLEAEDGRRLLEEVVALLKPRERQLFEMRQQEGLSTEEIATQTGIPKTSVAAMVSAARKKVFTELIRRMKQ